MNWSGIAAIAALVMMSNPAAAQDGSRTDPNVRTLTLSGCVKAGIDAGTFMMLDVTQVPRPDSATVPETAHGRRVLFWLDADDKIASLAGRVVEVTGRVTEVTESEVELKAGAHKEGGLLVELEGPGKDVRVPATGAGTIGASGGSEPEKNDLKTMLIRVHVEQVERTGFCNDR
jgi:hypothetical protein